MRTTQNDVFLSARYMFVQKYQNHTSKHKKKSITANQVFANTLQRGAQTLQNPEKTFFIKIY